LWAKARGFETEARNIRIYSTLDSAISGYQYSEPDSADR